MGVTEAAPALFRETDPEDVLVAAPEVVVEAVPDPTTIKLASYTPLKIEYVSGTWYVICSLLLSVRTWSVHVSVHVPVVGVGDPVRTHAVLR